MFGIVILTSINNDTNNPTNNTNTQELLNTKTNLQQPNSATNEFQDVSGKTIIKDALPETLKNIEAEIKAINTDLDKDFKSLEEQKEQLIAQTLDEDTLKAEAEAILKQASEDGADNKAIEKSFRTALDAPITNKNSLKLEKELNTITEDFIEAESILQSLGILDDNITESNNEN